VKNNKINPHTILLAAVLLVIGTVNADIQPTFPPPGSNRKPQVKVFDIELYPVKKSASQNLRLFPEQDELQVNAADLYKKALNALPEGTDSKQLDSMQNMSVKDFNIKNAQSVLKKYQKAIDLAAQAGRCKNCKWPPVKQPKLDGTSFIRYEILASAITLQARMQFVQGSHEKALESMQAGMAMARNLGRNPNIFKAISGVSVAHVMCDEVRVFLQQPDVPSLYRAVDALPEPFIDLDAQINTNKKNVDEKSMKRSQEGARRISQKVEREIAVIKCIEAIRLYASSHDSKLPDSLADITEPPIPKDPLTGKPFIYKITQNTATLKSPPSDDPADSGLRFNINLKKSK